jgi:hypothetical protein
MKPRKSCRKSFKMMGIMTLYSQYIYSLLLFVINNKNLFTINDEINEHKTRVYKDIYMPAMKLTKYEKGAYIAGIKVFNHLPHL